MRILIRTSKWAIWSRRFASFALPLAIIPIVMHRERMIETPTFHLIEGIAILIAAVALVLALGAFVRLWITGDHGWGKATMGLVLSLALLLPIVLGAIVALRYPRVTDVTTDPSDPPLLISGLTPQLQTPDVVAEVRTAFPNALSRTYPLQPAQIYQIVGALMQARGWDVRLRRAPQTALDEGQLNAIATTLLGWRDEVSIRIRGTADGGSEVDMRSTALTDIPDLGANGMRVEEFLLALDNEVTVLMRDTPAAAEPAESPA